MPRNLLPCPNGFDRQDFPPASPPRPAGTYTITYGGTLHYDEGRHHPNAFFQAVAQLFAQQPDLRQKLYIRCVGRIFERQRLDTLLHGLNLSANVQLLGYLPYNEYIHEIASADLLLIIHHPAEPVPELRLTIPAKTYDYLASRKPILCLSAGGALPDLIASLGVGISVAPTDTAGIATTLYTMIQEHPYGWGQVVEKEITKYNASYQICEFVHMLSSLLG